MPQALLNRRSAAFSPTITVGAWVLPCGIVGNTEQSATRRPSTPCTRSEASREAWTPACRCGGRTGAPPASWPRERRRSPTPAGHNGVIELHNDVHVNQVPVAAWFERVRPGARGCDFDGRCPVSETIPTPVPGGNPGMPRGAEPPCPTPGSLGPLASGAARATTGSRRPPPGHPGTACPPRHDRRPGVLPGTAPATVTGCGSRASWPPTLVSHSLNRR